VNEAAPIVQLLLTTQFQQPAQNLTIFDYADLREVYAEYPVRRHVPRAGPMPVMQPTTQITEYVSDAPRLQFMTEDLQWEILFQEDRISVGWNRTNSLENPSQYPGFTEVFNRFNKEFYKLSKFLLERGNDALKFEVGEVSYSDAFRLDNKDGSLKRMDEIFSNIRSIKNFSFNLVNLTYTKIVKGDYPAHVETNISGPALDSSGERAAFLRTTVRFAVEDESSLAARFDHAHLSAQEVFETLVNPDAFAILDAQ
jgi:uncharacterized protein (TIGR04255 family)